MTTPNGTFKVQDRRWPLDNLMPVICPVDQVIITADMAYVRYEGKVLCSAYCAHRYRHTTKGYVYIPESRMSNGKR